MRLTEAQSTALAAQAPALAKSLVKTPKGAVAFTNVQVYDAEAKMFLRDQTVIVDKGLIAAVFPAKEIEGARRARRSSTAAARRCCPGLWDCHMHVEQRLHGSAGTVDGRHLGTRPRQRRFADRGSTQARRPRASC